MVNKKGWLRIVEATIMILLILGVLVLINREKGYKEEKDYGSIFSSLLDEISKSVNRQSIFNSQGNNAGGVESSLKDSFKDKIPDNFYYNLEICPVAETDKDNCKLDNSKLNADERESLEKNNIYVVERIIGPDANYNSNNFNLIRIKLYAWEK